MSVKKVNKTTGATTKVAGLVNSEKVNTMYEAFPSDASASNKLVSDATADEKISDESQVIFEVMGRNGAKNLLPNIGASNTINGITYTVNEDGSVTADGTATSNSEFILIQHNSDIATEFKQNIIGKTLILSGCPDGGGSSKYHVRKWGQGSSGTYYDQGKGVTLTPTLEEYDSYTWNFQIRIMSGTTVSNLLFKPMLRLASDTDNTYQPYAKTNQQLTQDKAEQAEVNDIVNVLGAKNLLPWPYYNGYEVTSYGITFVVNDDGTITANGTNDGNSRSFFSLARPMILKKGTYVISKGTTITDTNMRVLKAEDTSRIILISDSQSYGTFTLSEDLSVYIQIHSSDATTFNNVTFYPMLCLASVFDETYAPPAKTNQKLTADAETLTNQVKDMNNVYGSKNVLDLTPRLKKKIPTGSAIVSFSNEGIVLNGTVSSSGNIRICPAEDDNSFVLPQGTYVLSHKDGSSPSGTGITLRKNGTDLITSNRLANPYEFEANGTDYFTVLFHESATTFDNAVVCPMICLKSFYELDTSFEPYAKTNQQLTEDTTSLLDNLKVNGAVNMLPNNATTQTINGVTFTVNDDGTIDVSGTATANANLTIGSFNVKAGTRYTISDGIGTLEHDDVAGVMYATSDPQQGAAVWYWRTDYVGADVDRRTAIANYDAVVTAYIRIPSGATVNYKFKPMFTLASYNGDYVPYAKSNKELTEDVESARLLQDAVTQHITVTADGTKTVQTLMNELHTALASIISTLDSSETLHVIGARSDGGTWFRPSNVELKYASNNTLGNVSMDSFTVTTGQNCYIYSVTFSSTLATNTFRQMSVLTSGNTFTDRTNDVPTSGTQWIMTYQIYKTV